MEIIAAMKVLYLYKNIDILPTHVKSQKQLCERLVSSNAQSRNNYVNKINI